MPARTDQYFVVRISKQRRLKLILCTQPEDSEIEVKHLPHATLRVIETIYGHVAGGGGGSKEDNEVIAAAVKEALRF